MFQKPLAHGKHALRLVSIFLVFLLSFALIQTQPAFAATFTPGCTSGVGDAAALASAVTTANSNGEADTINLAAGCTYTLTATLSIGADSGHLLTINGNGATISGNNAVRVFYINGGANVAFNNPTISGGSAAIGGGILSFGTVTLSGSIISGNQATGHGAGIANDGTLTIISSTIRGNTAGNYGGGLWNGGALTISNSTISGNQSTGSGGGGIYSAGSATISNSTVSGNQATTSIGGGIFNHGTMAITNSTISGNSAASVGDGLYGGTGSVTLINNIVTGNGTSDCYGLGITLSGPNLGCGGSVTGNANLGSFNGSTYPLLPGSAALDSGNNAICAASPVNNLDQIGNARPVDGDGNGTATCDLGAVEEQVSVPPDVSISPASANTAEGGSTAVTLTRSYSSANALTVSLNVTASGATTSDYTLSGGAISGQTGSVTASIPANQTSVNVTLSVTDDIHAEADESVTLTLVDTAAYNLGATTSSTTTIPANDLVAINANDSGEGSLRQAIDNANAFSSNDTITFSGVSGTITLTSGQLALANNGTLIIEGGGITVSGNNASRVFEVNSGANVTLNGMTITSGASSKGSGVSNNGTLTLNNSVVSGNSSTDDGGGLWNGGALTISNSTISGNSAASDGGGIDDDGGSSVTISNSIFSGNSAGSGDGGGMDNAAPLTITNSTFSGNSAGDDGGGLWNDGALTITNSTFSGNSAVEGGGIYNNNGTTTLNNSIVANSTGGDCVQVGGTVNTSHSLVEGGGCGVTNGVNGNRAGVDPALNGDLTLSASSPAINAGSNALVIGSTDLAGNPRIQNGIVDMGAFESGFSAPTLSINDVSLAEGNSGTTIFSFTVSLSAAAPSGGVTFDIATADNTATTADNDYVAQTLTGQTIPAGSTSFTFDVTVNGDTVAELDEIFFVNISNAIGATILDAQGNGTIINDDSTGIIVSPTSGLTTTEGGGTATFTVVLTSTPTADVVIALTSSNTAEGTVDPASLTFTSANWNVAQTVTVTGVDDPTADGDVVFNISFVVTSGDPNYDGVALPDVPVTNLDDDTSGVTISPTEFIGRENETYSYSIQLSSVPSGAVTIAAAFDPAYLELNGSSVSPVTLTFTNTAPQIVSARVVQNDNDDGNRTTRINHSISASSAAEYAAGTVLAAVTVNIEDFPPPPPVPTCEDHNFDEGGVVRSSTADAFGYAVNCRVMYQNGHPTTWYGADLYGAGNIGIQGVMDLGVQQAIDIFSPPGMTYFEGGAVFCLRGSGMLIWMAASQTPRHAEIIGSYTVPDFPGFTCATLFEPGTLVLVEGS